MRKRKFFKFFFYTLFLTVIKIKSKIFAFDEESFFQKTVILTHPVFSKHIISYDHPESPERIKYIDNALHKGVDLDNDVRVKYGNIHEVYPALNSIYKPEGKG